jgi:hypothetical protein
MDSRSNTIFLKKKKLNLANFHSLGQSSTITVHTHFFIHKIHIDDEEVLNCRQVTCWIKSLIALSPTIDMNVIKYLLHAMKKDSEEASENTGDNTIIYKHYSYKSKILTIYI